MKSFLYSVVAMVLCVGMTAAVGVDGATEPPTPSPNGASGTPAPTNALGTATNPAAPTGLATLRDPFWPVGYEKPQPKKKTKKIKKEEIKVKVPDKWPRLKVKGLTKTADGGYMAIVDRIGIVQTGDTIKLQDSGFVYHWKITSISPRGLGAKKLSAKPVGGSGKRGPSTPANKAPAGDGLR